MKTRNQKGQALVEMAIILPLLMLVVFGITEFGRAMFIMNTLNYAARAGARQAAVSNPFVSDSAIQTYVTGVVPASLQSGLRVNLGVSPAGPLHGQSTITVTVTRPFNTVVPVIIPWLNGITLSGQAAMLYE